MSFSKDHVIVVNERDEWLGTMEKLAAHEEGVLHRAFSVFILNENNELLLQQRADGKYHSGGLWSNTCCSHPMPGESTKSAAHRRLKEEMGFDCELQPLFHLRYRSDVGSNLIENEYDHIFCGSYNGAIHLNPEEVKSYKYVTLEAVSKWMAEQPQLFTEWFHLALPQFISNLKELGQAA